MTREGNEDDWQDGVEMKTINPDAAAMIARCGITPKGDFTLDGMKASIPEIVSAVNRAEPPRLLVSRGISVSVANSEDCKLRRLQAEIAGAWHYPEGKQRIAFDGMHVVTIKDLQEAGSTVVDSRGLLRGILAGEYSVKEALEIAQGMKRRREERDRGEKGTLWCLQDNEEWQKMNGKGVPCRHVPGTWEEKNIRDRRNNEGRRSHGGGKRRD